MRCPECRAEVEEGSAFCTTCGAPTTAYGGQVTGIVSEETRARAARLAVRPVVIPIVAAVDVLLAAGGLLFRALPVVLGRTQLNQEGTNYIGSAFSMLNVVVTLVVMGLLGLFLAFLAWSTWAQRTWAWWVNLALLGLIALTGLLGLGASAGRAVFQIVVAGGLLFLWLRSDVREWYGVA